ncbi:DMT family transporter [Oceanimonas baumannii]|uniref:Drug/metabolite transporter (DMT)-like permease n=1 Tax=Oceanimonas baumannii TaxID=129578 RepID=A0A235CFQ4_9GAMM|nr:DMT family transporter [Oceanimonas baumannii]OYD23380.1 multidrug DMT transporter permease [Oceanimonas baumannii]TDW58468.1 drug/metabolite transporter (DMT)-like permease [Oceanimonas baumannii]
MNQAHTLSSPSYRPLAGMAWGFLAVLLFSAGLPATRVSVDAGMSGLFTGAGRAALGALFAAVLLLLTRQRWPTPQQCARLAVVALGVVFGYPLLSSVALETVSATHGVLVTALLPLCTALFGAFLCRHRPRAGFWLCAVSGTVLVLFYAGRQAEGQWQLADLWLLLSCVLCGLGYAEGARLTKELGSWQVICWALVLSLPILLPIVWLTWPTREVALSGWLSLLYLGSASMFIGFFFWYRGLAIGGVTLVSQIQLLQPFSALWLSALLLGEPVSAQAIWICLAVVACVALGRRYA